MMEIKEGTEEDLKEFHMGNLKRTNLPYEVCRGVYLRWNCFSLWKNGEKLAIILEQDGYAHITACTGKHVGISLIREALKELKVTKTEVMNDYKKGHSLAKRLGFKLDYVDDRITHYVKVW